MHFQVIDGDGYNEMNDKWWSESNDSRYSQRFHEKCLESNAWYLTVTLLTGLMKI